MRKVEYTDNFNGVNFLKILGTFSEPMLLKWLHDRDGNKSSYYSFYFGDGQKEWRELYWNEFDYYATHKGKSWSYQTEERVILKDLFMEDFSDKSKRKIRYKFENLKGIIWGELTSESDKQKIREIVAELCVREHRTDFQYYRLEMDNSTRSYIVEREVVK